MECALTIAGSDPSGGAGIQADLRVFHSLGVHGMAVITALTEQSTVSVFGTFPVPEENLRGQLSALLEDIRPSALKTGMLFTAGAVRAVVDAVKEYSLSNLVMDPVAISTSGTRLLEDEAAGLIKERLLPLATVVTPNTDEAGWLASMSIRTPEDMEEAAARIRGMGPETVIVTGGDLGDVALDVVLDGDSAFRLETVRLPGSYHGTGCAYSACITALLANGMKVLDAAREAKELINKALRASFSPGRGMKIPRF